MNRGRRIGVDVGTVRIGVAICDPDGILATPLATVPRDVTQRDDPPSDMVEIARLVREHEIVEIIVGLPVNLAGKEGPAAVAIRKYVEILKTVVDSVPVLFTDERMSTVAAARRLSERGVRGRRQRAVVDQAAAVEILQTWLDSRRRRP
ncbi:Holliday junction resolvase RuvX [Planosporangium sp. 12N6]|uniref:Holliday junction resolvase RuvX n=1 Tax=Planosporangium spinosum TaxID=3402278 RepID=UPI003CFAAA13